MKTKQERCEEANKVIMAISQHGRRFFYSQSQNRTASMFVDKRGRVWFVDDYSGPSKPVYTHYRWDWRNFSHGGTMKRLIQSLRDYIMTGKQVNPASLCKFS